MGLYAIGDLHLHFGTALKPGHPQLRDRAWKKHEEKFRRNCARLLTEEDTLVLLGDHSWGRNEEECAPDLRYIMDLPGRKILLRGNHDMFWDAKKTAALNERYAGELEFLQNNCCVYRDYALVGTKGFVFEGPFFIDRRGRVVGWDEKNEAHAKKIVERELERLRLSFEAARSKGLRRFIMFLHYPPTSILEDESCFTRIAEEYRVEQVIYAHSHGESRFYDSVLGERNGVLYRLTSGDFLNWKPEKLLD